MTYPIPANEGLRLKELKRLRSNEWGHSEALDKLCLIASKLLGTPVTLVSLVHKTEQRFVGKVGLGIDGTSRGVAFCAHTIMESEPLIVENASEDARFCTNPLVCDVPGIAAYAGIPLETAPGLRVGTLCAIDFKPRAFTEHDIEILRQLGGVAQSILHSHRSTLELAEEAKARRKREKELWIAAHRDPLTGAANLKALRNAAKRRLASVGPKRKCALLLLDLDHFKLINDQWGHAEGDAYLLSVTKQLRKSVRRWDTVARIGGDEFAVLMPGLTGDREIVTEIVGRIQSGLKSIAAETGKPTLGRVSIGVALAPEHGTTLDELHKAADLALYESKALGRNTCRIYDPAMTVRAEVDARKRHDFTAALEAGKLVPYYQPKVDLISGAPIGFEALARWEHDALGLVPPSEFTFAFQDKELAPHLTRAIALGVARDVVAWRKNGLTPGCVSINVSPPDLMDKKFPNRFLGILAQYGIPPECVAIEVTENVVMGNRGGLLHNTLAVLRQAGVIISLDDFGTGYASLQHLRDWPVDQVKIDRSFVGGCLRNKEDMAIVKAIVQLANALGLGVTAEGIETKEQLALLRSMRCDLGQGYLFSPAMPARDVPSYLQRAGRAVA